MATMMQTQDWGHNAVALSALACCIASVLWVAAVRWRRARGNKRLAPAPPGLPLLGHLHLLGALPHQSLHKLAATYGPLMRLQLGRVPTIVASSPDAARELLKTHDHVFCSRPRTAAAVLTVYNRSDLGWAPYGPYWRHMRQICVTDLFSAKRMEAFRPMREQEALALVRSVWTHARSGAAPAPLELRPKLSATTYNIICRMAFGTRFEASAEMTELIAEVLELQGAFNIVDYMPFLERLDPQGCLRRMRAVAKRSDALLQSIIDRRRSGDGRGGGSAEGEQDSTDVLDALMAAAAAPGSGITDDNVKAVLWDMFAAGTDTSSVTAEWGLAELLRSSPELVRKLQEELEAVVGKARLMRESDIPQLPFLQAVVKETMRLHPAAPLLIPRESMQACDVAGFHVPSNTRALVNAWAIGRNAGAWDRPLEFVPDRFLGSSLHVKGQHFQLLPFGAGRRGCPGLSLGLANVHMMIGVLVHSFDWHTQNHISMHENFALTVCMANPLVATAHPRLPHDIYANVAPTA